MRNLKDWGGAKNEFKRKEKVLEREKKGSQGERREFVREKVEILEGERNREKERMF